MTWTYSQSTGRLSHDGLHVGDGYSGHGDGLNNPSMQSVQGVGPLPRGRYRIGGAYDDQHLGPCVMHLDPEPGTETHGRSLFRMHGDNAEANHTASDGCIIMGPSVRRAVASSPDRELEVVE